MQGSHIFRMQRDDAFLRLMLGRIAVLMVRRLEMHVARAVHVLCT